MRQSRWLRHGGRGGRAFLATGVTRAMWFEGRRADKGTRGAMWSWRGARTRLAIEAKGFERAAGFSSLSSAWALSLAGSNGADPGDRALVVDSCAMHGETRQG